MEYWRSGSQLYDKGDQLTEFHHREWEIDGIEMNRFAARWYDPTIARWHSPDPLEQMHSPYVALCNDPANFVDPDGRAGIHLSDWDKENIIGYASVIAGGCALAGIGQALQGASGIGQAFQTIRGVLSAVSTISSGVSLMQNIVAMASKFGVDRNVSNNCVIISNESLRSESFDVKNASSDQSSFNLDQSYSGRYKVDGGEIQLDLWKKWYPTKEDIFDIIASLSIELTFFPSESDACLMQSNSRFRWVQTVMTNDDIISDMTYQTTAGQMVEFLDISDRHKIHPQINYENGTMRFDDVLGRSYNSSYDVIWNAELSLIKVGKDGSFDNVVFSIEYGFTMDTNGLTIFLYDAEHTPTEYHLEILKNNPTKSKRLK